MSLRIVARAGAIAAALVFCQVAPAQTVLYSNMSTSDSFNYNSSWIIANNYTSGVRITSVATAPLDMVIAPVSVVCHYVATVCQTPSVGTTMQIWMDVLADNNNAPGALLARSSTIAVPTAGEPHSFAFASGTTLEAGSRYWIRGGSSSPVDLGAGWAWNTHATSGTLGLWRGTSFDQFQSLEHALQVLSPVPEPAQWVLLAISLLGLATRRHGAPMLRRLVHAFCLPLGRRNHAP